MALIVSAQSGNWEDPTTWVGGVVPALTDDKTIAVGHTVTVAAEVTSEGTLRLEGELSINTDVIFTLGSSVTLAVGNLIFAGGTLSGEGTFSYAWSRITSEGDAWSTVTCKTFVRNTTAAANGYRSWNISKILFKGLASLQLWEGRVDHAGVVNEFVLENCVFKECTLANILQAAWSSASPDIVFENLSFVDNINVQMGGGSSLQTLRFNKCLFKGGNFKMGGVTKLGIFFKNCAMLSCYFQQFPQIYGIENCYMSSDIREAYICGDARAKTSGTFTRNVVFAAPPCENNRAIVHPNASYNFVEDMSAGSGGSNTFFADNQTATYNVPYTFTHNVVMSASADGFTSMPLAGAVLNHTLTNNTCLGRNFADYERNTPSAESSIVLKNNMLLPYEDTVGIYPFFKTIGGMVGPLHITADYNHKAGNNDWFQDTITNDVTGSNNVSHDALDYPQFKDGTRSQERYAKEVLGIEYATYQDFWDYAYGVTGYNANTETNSEAVLAETFVPDMHSWLMAGYVPTNMALATAGEGGTYIGALEPQSVVVVTAEISLKANANTVTIGDNVTYTLTLSEVLPEDLLVTVTIGNVDRSTTISANALEGYISFTTATVGNLVAQIKGTDNGNVTITGQIVNVVVNDVAPPPPQGKFFRPLEVATVDESHVNLTVPSGVTGELQITLTYTKG